MHLSTVEARQYEFVGKRLIGTVKSFSAGDGWGFISCPQTADVFGRDIFAQADQIGSLCPGHMVSFELFLNATGRPQAKHVVLETVCHGYIKSFVGKTGFGFIACSETFEQFHRDVFVGRDVIGEMKVGQEVAFKCILNGRKQPQAATLQAETNGTSQMHEVTVAGAPAANPEASCSPTVQHASLDHAAPSSDMSADLYDPFATPADDSGTVSQGHVPNQEYDPFATPAEDSRTVSQGHVSNQEYDPFATPVEDSRTVSQGHVPNQDTLQNSHGAAQGSGSSQPAEPYDPFSDMPAFDDDPFSATPADDAYDPFSYDPSLGQATRP